MFDLKVGVSGVTGFIGNEIYKRLQKKGLKLTPFTRYSSPSPNSSHHFLDLERVTCLSFSVPELDVFVHCAGMAHKTPSEKRFPLSMFIRVNTNGTLTLAERLAAHGAKRFVYISSANINHRENKLIIKYRDGCKINPIDYDLTSKALTEEGLREIAARTGMEVTIIRPPLVYGPGVKANFAAMMRLAQRNLPLPLASVRNKRSMVALDNLVDLIVTCVSHPNAGNQTFMVSDDADVSTPELLSAMTRAYGKKPRLLPCPPGLLSFAARVLGKRAIAERLLGSLQVDIKHTQQVLGWTPRVKLEDVLKEMVRDSLV
ncbi:NAD-dependent epimerase/dehydratase family protein [Pseudidiomarina taiwanensis]|uniref:NAD-dependent epimerase/dehydratase family protein n=1 Tax=Pseudidiomarina taiwanensis TaxID=337250 RepID=UPI001F548280|nr:NAD-dependent epimerase/dehydratase family protein [Pseudidiomarina taiwanensis]